MGQVPRGNTLLRIRFGWGFIGSTSTLSSLYLTAENAQVFGIVTVAGNGSETPPDPRTSPGDPSPPLSRWLWWEARVPTVQAWDGASQTAIWHDSPRSEADDARGQVSASVPAGDSLDIWASWAPAFGWDDTGTANVWFWASILYKPTV